jgi:hypothetical protein
MSQTSQVHIILVYPSRFSTPRGAHDQIFHSRLDTCSACRRVATFLTKGRVSPVPHLCLCNSQYAVSLALKQPGCEAAHAPSSSAEVKNDGAMPPLPHMCAWASA